MIISSANLKLSLFMLIALEEQSIVLMMFSRQVVNSLVETVSPCLTGFLIVTLLHFKNEHVAGALYLGQ